MPHFHHPLKFRYLPASPPDAETCNGRSCARWVTVLGPSRVCTPTVRPLQVQLACLAIPVPPCPRMRQDDPREWSNQRLKRREPPSPSFLARQRTPRHHLRTSTLVPP